MGGIIFKNSGQESAKGNAIMIGLIATLAGYNAWLWGTNLKKKLKGELSPTDKLAQIRTTNIVTNLTLVSTMFMQYYQLNKKRIKPAAVLAGVPLGTVEELSMALSDRLIKYRATGGVFLAHQDGGNESLRIVCKAWGKDRYYFLILLDFLFMYGQSKILDMFDKITKINAPGEYFSKEDLTDLTEVNNPWQQFDKENIDEGREEYHLTFPIVTKNRIFSSMYLETYDIVESVNAGMNILTVTLFLRKYRPPYPLKLIKIKEDIENKKPKYSTWYKEEKSKTGIPLSFRSLRWIDGIMDFGLSLIVMMHKYYSMREYSIYTPEQMWALTFATHLDKSRGLNAGFNFDVFRDRNGKVKVGSIINLIMGIVL